LTEVGRNGQRAKEAKNNVKPVIFEEKQPFLSHSKVVPTTGLEPVYGASAIFAKTDL
jgi:hypothetical protein